MTFKFKRSTLARLRTSVSRGAMTVFVERALLRALDELDANTSR
jgi:hypothetical protein